MGLSLVAPRWRSVRMLLVAVVVVAGLVAGFSAQRASAQPAEPEFLCAAPWTGALYYLPNGCPKSFAVVDMTAGPVDVCASGYTGQLMVQPVNGCPASHAAVQIGSGSGGAACAIGYTAATHWMADAGQPCAGQVLEWAAVVSNGSCDNCPVAIPEVGQAVGTATVSGLAGLITDVNVYVDISHTSIGDLEIYLQSPLGTIVQIYDQECLIFQDDLEATFDDEAATAIGATCPPAGGTYQPSFPLSAFDGEDPNGIWTLTVDDILILDSGTLNDWSLQIAVP